MAWRMKERVEVPPIWRRPDPVNLQLSEIEHSPGKTE
jgi:hypothetical protein